MAVVYFTSNAATGAGSLAEAIQNAQPGDVVRPDETVFERGSTIEIVLASTFIFNKNLTLDASPFRVVLDGDGLARCCRIAGGANVEITSFRFVGGGWNSQTGAAVGSPSGAGLLLEADAKATLNRCEFYGCRGAYGGAFSCSDGSTARLNDCVVAGCAASGACGGVRSRGDVEIYGSTIVGNAGAGGDIFVDASGAGRVTLVNSVVGTYSGNVEIGAGSVVDVASSAVGFVASPPDDLTVETWNANAWENWDLRLLDDASDSPSPYRDSGSVDNMSRYDLDGNFRGREVDGPSTCSPGAYETIQADLFWIGRDATGAEVVSPSFLTSDGWAASRFATASGDVAPQKDDAVFVDGVVSFDGCDVALTRFIVGGCAAIRFAASGTQTLNATNFNVGTSALVESTAGTQKLGVRDSVSVSRFSEYTYVKTTFSTSSNESFQIASTARFSDFANAKIVYRQGFFDLYRFNIGGSAVIDGDVENVVSLWINAPSTSALTATNSPRIVCESFTWSRSEPANGENSALTDGSTPLVIEAAKTVKISGAVLPNDCRVDVSRAEPDGALALTLTGQTVYGDAPTAAVSLSGSAKVAERGLDVASLTLNADATLNVENATVNAETLNLSDGSKVTVDGGSVDAESLTSTAGSTLTIVGARVAVATLIVADDANVAFSPVKTPDATDEANATDGTNATGINATDEANATAGGNAIDGTNGTAATYVDAILTATASATVGAATFAGTGYFATPQGTDVTAATFETSVRRVDFCAKVKTFAATATGPTTAKLAFDATDETARVCVERENAASPNCWETLAFATSAESPLSVALSGNERFRIFDGQTFYVDSAWFPTSAFYVYVADDISAVATVAVEWETATQLISAGNVMYRNENVLLLASIKNKLTAVYLSRDEVESATATVYAVSPGFGAREIWSPVDGWENIAVPLDAILEAPAQIDGWTLDAVGPNFVWTPDATTRPLFGDSGTFAVQVCVKRKSGGNPIYFTFRAVVK